MRFHVVSLPWTETTREYEWCAYTSKVRKFCDMMSNLGHEVYLYASRRNQAACTSHINCVTSLSKMDFTPNSVEWVAMNNRVIKEISDRIQPGDFICLIAGLCQEQIAAAFEHETVVEFGVGYGGTFANFRVFESYAWMHTVYGYQQGTHSADGRFYDTVIPNYFDVNDFAEGSGDGDYYLFVGRHIWRKGVQVAADVCKHLGERLIVAGTGPEPPDYGEFVGLVGPENRSRLMGGAKAVFVPTLYVEPFGGVAVEAMLCGTPVITTDFGAFTETVLDGVTGYRCHTLQEFVDAARQAPLLDRSVIRDYAQNRFSMDVVAVQYERYFERLAGLRTGGWGTLQE